jgi:hypothetical protein
MQLQRNSEITLTREDTKHSEKNLSATLSTKNTTWTGPRSTQPLCCERTVCNHPSHGTDLLSIKDPLLFINVQTLAITLIISKDSVQYATKPDGVTFSTKEALHKNM